MESQLQLNASNSASPSESTLDVKFTLDEYRYELNNQSQLQKPNPTDPEDPLYYRKYASTMPPLEAYKFRPVQADLVNVPGDDNRRAVFYGWNNLTDHEVKNI